MAILPMKSASTTPFICYEQNPDIIEGVDLYDGELIAGVLSSCLHGWRECGVGIPDDRQQAIIMLILLPRSAVELSAK